MLQLKPEMLTLPILQILRDIQMAHPWWYFHKLGLGLVL